jgi:hypothetical protein
MHASGAQEAAVTVARDANYARIADMRFPELATWANNSGLAIGELARIQPAYAPSFEEVEKYVPVALAVWFLGALAVNSILFNSCRLILAYTPRLTTMILGFSLGIVLLYIAARIDARGSGWFHEKMQAYQDSALFIGILSVLCAVITFTRRAKWRPAWRISDLQLPRDVAANSSNEQLKAADSGRFCSLVPAKDERIQQSHSGVPQT